MTTRPTTRPRRDCRCLRVRHEHGTRRAYEADRCRCLLCRSAHSNAVRAYRSGGTWREAYIDATATKKRLRALSVVGVTNRRIAAHTGLSVDMITYLRVGPGRQVTPANATLIEDAYTALWLRGRNTADARRCSTQAKALGYARSFGVDVDDEPELQDHGTHAAFTRHKNHGETPCTDCIEGERQYQADRYERRKVAA